MMTVPVSISARRLLADGTARWASYGTAAIVAVTLGHFLLGLPIQVSDSFGHMQQLAHPGRTCCTAAWVPRRSVRVAFRALSWSGQVRQAATTERIDWAHAELDRAAGLVHASTPDGRALLSELRDAALIAHPSLPPLDVPFQVLLGD
jgi:hypothetical protein